MTDKCPNCGFTVELSPRERRLLLYEGSAKHKIINMLKTAMGDAICEIDDRDYDNAREVLEFALAGKIPVSEALCIHGSDDTCPICYKDEERDSV